MSRVDESPRGAVLPGFAGGWARVPCERASSAHHYEQREGWWVSICGGHKNPPTDIFEPGDFHRCLRCQRGLLVRHARPE